MAPRLPLFVTAARGTEELLAAELKELGAAHVRQDRGGVRCQANLDEALHLCLWSRIAMRVFYSLGEFTAEGPEGLYQAARDVPWEEHLTSDSTFMVETTMKDSEHRHSGFVSLKIKDAIADRLRSKLGGRPDVDTRHPQVRVVAHLAGTKLTLSLDLCGEPLHKRGYRVQQTPAPLKETLAAALLAAVGYRGEESLVDPMCGSGTIPIEAALIAMRRAPGLRRRFAVEQWPTLGASAKEKLDGLRSAARAQERKIPFPIRGFDRDEEAVQAARANVKRAGLESAVQIELGDATATLPWPDPPGLLLTNPPYGDRLSPGGQKGMKRFYFQLGENLPTSRLRLAVFCGNPAFESAFHQKPIARRTLWNGPIECALLSYPAAS